MAVIVARIVEIEKRRKQFQFEAGTYDPDLLIQPHSTLGKMIKLVVLKQPVVEKFPVFRMHVYSWQK